MTYSTQIMATAEGVSCLEIHSYVRGYHAYKNVWEPARGEALLVTREATNPLDKHMKHAVANYKEDIFVGHVPYNLAPRLSQFLTHYRPVDMDVRLPPQTAELVLTGCVWIYLEL